MTNKETFTDAVREALAKKQEAARPKAKKSKGKNQQNYGVPVITGAPVRRNTGRGG
jgi:hypothetical protein